MFPCLRRHGADDGGDVGNVDRAVTVHVARALRVDSDARETCEHWPPVAPLDGGRRRVAISIALLLCHNGDGVCRRCQTEALALAALRAAGRHLAHECYVRRLAGKHQLAMVVGDGGRGAPRQLWHSDCCDRGTGSYLTNGIGVEGRGHEA